MKERDSVTRETAVRYKNATKNGKKAILNEYVTLTGFARKYAITRLNSCIRKKEHRFNNVSIKTASVEVPKKKRRVYRPVYGPDVLNSLVRIWSTFDYMCGQRLVPFIRENIGALQAEPCFEITPEVCGKLRTISSATVNRLLKAQRQKNKPHGISTTKAAGNLSALIPVRAFFDWDERIPGFFEMDTVSHDGGNTCGEYCYTLTFTDVCTGWTELRSLLNKAQRWVKEGAQSLKSNLPYELRGLDSDNGSEFKNYQMLAWCKENKITFTRSRSYKKNDNCFVEQKNYSVVRRIAGYNRYEGEPARAALQNLYDRWILLVNYFYPSVKILEKERRDARTYKKYDSAKTPYRRCLESGHLTEDDRAKLRRNKAELNVVRLKKQVEDALDAVLQLAKKWN